MELKCAGRAVSVIGEISRRSVGRLRESDEHRNDDGLRLYLDE